MGFALPYGLASLLFAAALVLLHLRRRQQKELEVSSLLLWEAVRDEPPRGRFRANPLFLLQLADSLTTGGSALEIDVFTDLPRDEVAFTPSAGERLRYFRFGRSDDNVAVAALRVYQSPFQDADEARGYALVRNYADHGKDVDGHAPLGGKPIPD